MSERTLRSPIYAIPDDPEQSAYRFIIVAAKRARQLQGGARSFLPSTVKKSTIAAMEEVRRGLIGWEDLNQQAEFAERQEQ
jgi:DNA-directed RNA polymerase subunit omega